MSTESDLALAERLGEFGARIGALEQRQGEEFRDLRSSMQRLEAALMATKQAPPPQGPSPDVVALSQAMHRWVDQQSKQPPHDGTVIERLLDRFVKAQNAQHPVLIFLAVVGAFAIAWVARGVIPGV